MFTKPLARGLHSGCSHIHTIKPSETPEQHGRSSLNNKTGICTTRSLELCPEIIWKIISWPKQAMPTVAWAVSWHCYCTTIMVQKCFFIINSSSSCTDLIHVRLLQQTGTVEPAAFRNLLECLLEHSDLQYLHDFSDLIQLTIFIFMLYFLKEKKNNTFKPLAQWRRLPLCKCSQKILRFCSWRHYELWLHIKALSTFYPLSSSWFCLFQISTALNTSVSTKLLSALGKSLTLWTGLVHNKLLWRGHRWSTFEHGKWTKEQLVSLLNELQWPDSLFKCQRNLHFLV